MNDMLDIKRILLTDDLNDKAGASGRGRCEAGVRGSWDRQQKQVQGTEMTQEELQNIAGLIQRAYNETVEYIQKDARPDMDREQALKMLECKTGAEIATVMIVRSIMKFYGQPFKLNFADGTEITVGEDGSSLPGKDRRE